MATTVPMLAPDGTSGEIPQERVQDAMNAGFKKAVEMTSPDGQLGYIPEERVADAQGAGFKVNPYRGGAMPTGTLSAQPEQSSADKAAQWAANVKTDLEHGTDLTGVGHVLKALGAHGLYNGNSQAVGDFMGSLPLGLARMAQGGGEEGQGHVVQGVKDTAAGALQAATIPSSVVSPETSEVAAEGARGAASAMASLSPTAAKARAAGVLQSVAHDANQVPVSLDNAGDAAWNLMKWQDKTQLGPTLNKFLNRVTNPKKGPLTYEEARDYYQLLGKMSVDEALKLAPTVKYQLGNLVNGLKTDIGNAAGVVGRAADYYQGMGDFATAAKHAEWVQNARNWALKTGVPKILEGFGTGALGAAGWQLYRHLTDSSSQ